MNKIILALVFAALLIIGGVVYVMNKNTSDYQAEPEEVTETPAVTEQVETPDLPEPEEPERGPRSVIGQSVEGNDITAYHFGDGNQEILFIGGIHGGYSFNTSLVAFELIDYLEDNPELVPEGHTVTVIPVLNPDGLEEIVGSTGRFDGAEVTSSDSARVAGRFNANDVDLNRNFDCEWSETGTWQDRTVSGGAEPFSEPESLAIRTYVNEHNIAGAVVWYSQAGGVFASQCGSDTMAETRSLTKIYADASGYRAYEEFNFYEITGDMVNWFAKERIPAISVLLTNHEQTEWSKNQAGIDALLASFAE